MIRDCTGADIDAIETIINEAAQAYRGVVPDDCWHEPYMSRSQLLEELAHGVSFSGWQQDDVLMGVMGLQSVRDVTLIRHAYVRTAHQGKGIGSTLLSDLTARAGTRLLVGTWADAGWAIRLYQKHGFQLVTPREKDRLLETYWNIPRRQQEVSVVLEHRA